MEVTAPWRVLREPLALEHVTPDALCAYIDAAFEVERWLFDAIVDEGLYASADPLRHPLIFYLGHPAAFYANKLRLQGAWSHRPPTALETLLAEGVDPAKREHLPARECWPAAREVRAFREAVRSRVLDWAAGITAGPVRFGDARWAAVMAAEHQLLHFETSSVLVRQLPLTFLRRPDGWHEAPAHPPETARPGASVEVPGGAITLGKRDGDATYGWDNEHGSLDVTVPDLEVGAHLVTNLEYEIFVQSGGYAREDLWEPDGWAWVRSEGARRPRFWGTRAGSASLRTVFDERPLPPDWPVEVCHHEARAYATWRGEGARLPTEAEARHLAQRCEAQQIEPPNVALRWCSPAPVRYVGALDGGWGNVWQHLGDDFAPLPGFRVDPLYAHFSAPYFDAEHKMMLGASWATLGAATTRHYRLWFRKHFQQHAGFRWVRTR